MELIPPNTIHIINLNHYLEDSPFAQYLLEHNKQMEPNMNFKIWTENDELVKNYNGFFKKHNNNNGIKSAIIAMMTTYLYGGTYCELDYEYLHKDFYYNLYNNEPDVIYSTYCQPLCRLWDQCVYFLKKKNKIAKLSIELFCHFNDTNDILAVSDEHSLQLIDKEELMEMKKKVKIVDINNINHYYNHYRALRKNIKFCKLENFTKTTSNCNSTNKYYMLAENLENIDYKYFSYSYEVFNKYRLREIYNLLSKFPQFEIEVLDDCLD